MANRKYSILTVRQYAEEEGITIQTVYRRIWQRQISARRMYGRWLISAGRAVEDAQQSMSGNLSKGACGE